MNYELNQYLATLHQHILNEQSQIRTLIKMLLHLEQKHEQIDQKVTNIIEGRTNAEKRKGKNTPQNNAILIGEKDSNFSMFLKLNQQLQKWIELELSLLKEISKTQNSATSETVDGELRLEDLSILQNYYSKIISE
jgi:hypothetical protein